MRYFADYIKGKPYQKTVLWENSSPTSNFSAQTVTLSDDVTNYDEIQIISYNTTTDTTTRTTTLVKSDLLKATEFAINEYITSASASFNRYVTKQSNTSFLISTAYRWNTSSTTSNAYIIPVKIIGIKKGLGEKWDIDLLNPDIIDQHADSADYLRTINTIKKPRYIVKVDIRSGSYVGYIWVIDCVNEVIEFSGSNPNFVNHQSLPFSDYIKSISDSSFTIKNVSTTSYNTIFVYY